MFAQTPMLKNVQNILYNKKTTLLCGLLINIINKTLEKKPYLYYNGKRNINIKEGLYSIDLELSHKIKLFNDLIGNYQDDEKYTANLKKFAVSNFSNKINDKNKIQILESLFF